MYPMMSDRVKILRRLINHFLPREEYLLNDSEFLNAQARAISPGEPRRMGENGLAADLLNDAASNFMARTKGQGGK